MNEVLLEIGPRYVNKLVRYTCNGAANRIGSRKGAASLLRIDHPSLGVTGWNWPTKIHGASGACLEQVWQVYLYSYTVHISALYTKQICLKLHFFSYIGLVLHWCFSFCLLMQLADFEENSDPNTKIGQRYHPS